MLLNARIALDGLDFSGKSGLMYAAHQGHKDIVRLLLERGSIPDIQDNEGITGLHWAALEGHSVIVEMLLEAEANPNAMEVNGDKATPLDYAVNNGHAELAEKMKEYGCLSNKDIQELAATHVQASFRGYQARKKVTLMKQSKEEREIMAMEALAASKIQAGWRGKKQRDKFKEDIEFYREQQDLREWVIMAQSLCRGYIVRSKLPDFRKIAAERNAKRAKLALKKKEAEDLKNAPPPLTAEEKAKLEWERYQNSHLPQKYVEGKKKAQARSTEFRRVQGVRKTLLAAISIQRWYRKMRKQHAEDLLREEQVRELYGAIPRPRRSPPPSNATRHSPTKTARTPAPLPPQQQRVSESPSRLSPVEPESPHGMTEAHFEITDRLPQMTLRTQHELQMAQQYQQQQQQQQKTMSRKTGKNRRPYVSQYRRNAQNNMASFKPMAKPITISTMPMPHEAVPMNKGAVSVQKLIRARASQIQASRREKGWNSDNVVNQPPRRPVMTTSSDFVILPAITAARNHTSALF
jgi:hypothetical protein